MNTNPEFVALHDGRPGVRTLLQVDVAAPSGEEARGASSSAVLDFVSSTATLDRYQEIIEPSGWRLESYRRNPVFQNAHNYGDILFTLGKALVTEVRTVGAGQALCQRIEFATEVNPVARIAYGLYSGGFLNAVSVGFIPIRWEVPDGTNGSNGTPGTASLPRRRYVEQELLEVSAVAIPANPDALALGVKAGAVAKSDIEATLDLLRALTVDYGPWRPPQCVPAGAAFNPEFVQYARALRDILRRT
jgi:hypothetical protein